MLKASIVALFIMLSTQHEIVNLISPTVTIFVSTRPLVNCTLVTSCTFVTSLSNRFFHHLCRT